MNSAITIRPINMNDRPLIEDFFAAMGEYSSSFFNVDHGNEKRILRYFDRTLENHLIWLATLPKEDGGEICVGIVFFYDAQRMVPWLGIAVRDGYHGMHIGTDLIEYAKVYARETGCGGIVLTTAQTNFKGQRLYEHRGFIREGVHTSGEYLYIYYFER